MLIIPRSARVADARTLWPESRSGEKPHGAGSVAKRQRRRLLLSIIASSDASTRAYMPDQQPKPQAAWRAQLRSLYPRKEPEAMVDAGSGLYIFTEGERGDSKEGSRCIWQGIE